MTAEECARAVKRPNVVVVSKNSVIIIYRPCGAVWGYRVRSILLLARPHEHHRIERLLTCHVLTASTTGVRPGAYLGL